MIRLFQICFFCTYKRNDVKFLDADRHTVPVWLSNRQYKNTGFQSKSRRPLFPHNWTCVRSLCKQPFPIHKLGYLIFSAQYSRCTKCFFICSVP
jgi:hypothetical protein